MELELIEGTFLNLIRYISKAPAANIPCHFEELGIFLQSEDISYFHFYLTLKLGLY